MPIVPWYKVWYAAERCGCDTWGQLSSPVEYVLVEILRIEIRAIAMDMPGCYFFHVI